MILGGKTIFHIVHILKSNQNSNECLGGKDEGGRNSNAKGIMIKKINTMDSKVFKVGI